MAEIGMIVEELQTMPRFLREVVSRLPHEKAAAKLGDGEFSLVEHACHLRDFDREGSYVRMCRILEEDNPKLEDFPGSTLAVERRYSDQNLQAAVNAFATERTRVVGILAALDREKLERKARFGRLGQMTLFGLAEAVVDHDRTHREEIEQLLRGLGSR